MTYWARNAALFFIGIVDVQPELDAALPQGKQRAGRKRETIVAAAHEKAAEQIRPEACQRLPYGEIAGELIEDFEDLRFQIFRLTRLRIKSPAAGPGSTDSPSLTAFKFLPLVMRNGWSRSELGTDFFGQEVVPEESEGYQGMIECGHGNQLPFVNPFYSACLFDVR